MERCERASCKHLTYPYAAYMGCTLSEVLFIAAIYFVFDSVLSALLCIFYGKFFLLFIGTFVLSYFLVRRTASFIGDLKAGKQPGYITLRLKQWLHLKLNRPLPFVTSQGIWSRRRKWT